MGTRETWYYFHTLRLGILLHTSRLQIYFSTFCVPHTQKRSLGNHFTVTLIKKMCFWCFSRLTSKCTQLPTYVILGKSWRIWGNFTHYSCLCVRSLFRDFCYDVLVTSKISITYQKLTKTYSAAFHGNHFQSFHKFTLHYCIHSYSLPTDFWITVEIGMSWRATW